ncbi:hypothetical protein [Helicobacter mehlei]|uniref:Integral membrane protein n=1 Tax=Helicobacter mehlei TaxID=2316080 RepID=A0A553UZD0_9HELI|nr:hypothetical protein [Helicobacter mehlei]TSA85572.1 hypothetical protein FNE76_03630 [Helicobacter mehlei]
MKRKSSVGIAYAFHAYASVFFLPMVLLFVVSGGAYYLGFNSNTGAQISKWSVPAVATQQELDFLIAFLKDKQALPSKIEARKFRGALVIGTPAYEASLVTKGEKSEITLTKRSFLGVIMQVHKGRANKALLIFAGIFVVFLCLLYVSGLSMGIKRKTKGLMGVFLLGVGVLGVLLWSAL